MRHLASFTLLLGACGAEPPATPTPSATPDATPTPSATPDAALACADSGACQEAPPRRRPHMWPTCGDPVCRGWTPKPGVRDCGAIQEGDRCPAQYVGAMCDPHDACNSLLECRRDPSYGPCPISKAEYKYDIDYLGADASDALRKELMAFRLATWHYNEEAPTEREHLGFIIDDVPGSAAVAADGDHVDLYGYTTMAVATLQAQQKQIDAQRAEIDALRKELAEIRDAVRAR